MILEKAPVGPSDRGAISVEFGASLQRHRAVPSVASASASRSTRTTLQAPQRFKEDAAKDPDLVRRDAAAGLDERAGQQFALGL